MVSLTIGKSKVTGFWHNWTQELKGCRQDFVFCSISWPYLFPLSLILLTGSRYVDGRTHPLTQQAL